MSNANIAFVQNLYAAFGKGDIATLIKGLSTDVDWQSGGRTSDYPGFGQRKGQPQVQEFFKFLAENNDFAHFSPREFFAVGDRVFVLGDYAMNVQEERQELQQRLGPRLHDPRGQGGALP
jgi:ketosteroid isomerase-like protein